MQFVMPKQVSLPDDTENEDCSFAYFSKNPLLRSVFLQRLKVASSFIPEHFTATKDNNHLVLDIGSGCGFMFPTLSCVGTVVAFDYVPEYLHKAKVLADAHQLPVRYVNGNVYQLPFADKSFMVINALSVLEHIQDVDQAVREIYRILHDDGVLIVGVPVERILVNTLFGLLAFKDKAMLALQGKKDAAVYRKNKYQDVHYSDVTAVEQSLVKQFVIINSQKIFSNYLPDAVSLYKIFCCQKQSLPSHAL